MTNKILELAAAFSIFASAASSSAKSFSEMDDWKPRYNPDYSPTGIRGERPLREFHIKGQTVMARSRKDALKKLNPKKKRK